MMKAMQLEHTAPIGEHPLRLVEREIPQPGPGQVRVRLEVCGVCHTDLHTVEGDLTLPRLPIVPGHQWVGVVDAVGPGVTRRKIGERVGVAWLWSSCGACRYCQAGQENLCPHAQFTGLHVDGGYSEYGIVGEAFAFPLPEGFAAEEAAPLLCAGIVGYRALRLSGARPGDRVGLYGFGASAHLVIQVARHWGCEVHVFTRSEAHRRLAEELGASWTGSASDDHPADLDASVVFAPAGWVARAALSHLRPGGVVAINAIHMSPIPEIPYALIYGERVLRSVANLTRQDAEEFLRLAGEIPIRTEVEVFPLEEANLALERLKASEINGAAVLRIS